MSDTKHLSETDRMYMAAVLRDLADHVESGRAHVARDKFDALVAAMSQSVDAATIATLKQQVEKDARRSGAGASAGPDDEDDDVEGSKPTLPPKAK